MGGDTAHKTVPLLHKLRAANKGALFAYSVEVDEAEATAASSNSKRKERPPHKRIVDEMVRCIDVAADFEDGITGKLNVGRRTWVAVKMVRLVFFKPCQNLTPYYTQSALVPDAHVLLKLSSHIMSTRPSPQPSIPFPGCPHPTDLDALFKPLMTPSNDSDALNAEDIASLRELHADLVRICTRAQERGVKIIIDAEYRFVLPLFLNKSGLRIFQLVSTCP